MNAQTNNQAAIVRRTQGCLSSADSKFKARDVGERPIFSKKLKEACEAATAVRQKTVCL
jgi:hypothetical protein